MYCPHLSNLQHSLFFLIKPKYVKWYNKTVSCCHRHSMIIIDVGTVNGHTVTPGPHSASWALLKPLFLQTLQSLRVAPKFATTMYFSALLVKKILLKINQWISSKVWTFNIVSKSSLETKSTCLPYSNLS